MRTFISTVSYSQDEIIKNILELHVPSGKIDCDVTYSKGVFYKNITPPNLKFDINPQTEDTIQADCRHLPVQDSSIDCLMFDPPFLATKGSSLNQTDDNNVIAKRFGVFPSEKELHQFYIDSMAEFHRVLKDDGILIFKCQDKVSSGKQYLSHYFILSQAIKLGYYPKDLFILLSKSRLVAEWQVANQKHARKYHCYFLVLQKSNKVIEYV